MQCLIVLVLIALVIYGIILALPYIATGLIIILAGGGVVGLPVGIFYGFKSYMLAIAKNISNKFLKVLMIIITCASILAFVAGVAFGAIFLGEGIIAQKNLDDIESHRKNGINYVIAGAYDKALVEFGQAIQKTKPEDSALFAELHAMRGRAMIALIAAPGSVVMLDGKFNEIDAVRTKKPSAISLEQAIADFSTAIDSDPKNPVYYNERGRAYAFQDSDVKAIMDFDKAISLNFKYPFVYNSMGNMYAYKNSYDMAIKNYNMAVHLDPNFSVAYFNRSDVYAKKRNYSSAISDLEKAIKINPNYEQAKKALKQIQAKTKKK
jgi:tetratricopeptide (TPR) repeat protein